jgi:YgiT-type zinc finger domain-containing protein
MEDQLHEEQKVQKAQYFNLCSECQAGIMRLKYLTYFTWLNDELITVPNFPAWVCDICGRREYDSQAVSRLNTLLSSEGSRAKPKKHRQQKTRSRPSDQALP